MGGLARRRPQDYSVTSPIGLAQAYPVPAPEPLLVGDEARLAGSAARMSKLHRILGIITRQDYDVVDVLVALIGGFMIGQFLR